MCFVLKVFYSSILLILFMKISGISTAETGPYHGKSIVCYWSTWSMYRPNRGNFQFEYVDPTLCTHLILAFALLSDVDNSITILGEWPDLVLDKNKQNNISKLKNKYPHLKILVSIGGWQDGSVKYSRMAEDPEKRNSFINSTIHFITKNNLDGLDIFWEFPTKRGGSLSDKVNFLQLVKELRAKFDQHNFLLTAAIGASKDTIDNGYDVMGLSSNLHLMLVMCYDYHGLWSRNIGANAPLHGSGFLNVEFTIKHLLKLGAYANKLILGVPLYGRSFIMERFTNETIEPPRLEGNLKNHTFYGNFTKDEQGSMGYNEICPQLFDKTLGWTVHWDWNSKTPYAVNGDKLISYDNDRSLIEKTRFAMQYGLGGIMAWSIDMDDFRGDCYQIVDGYKEFPLLRAINRELHDFAMHNMSSNDIEASPVNISCGLRLKLDYFIYCIYFMVFIFIIKY